MYYTGNRTRTYTTGKNREKTDVTDWIKGIMTLQYTIPETNLS